MAVTYNASTITLDNPPANSYEISFMKELAGAIEAAEADQDARVVVVRSASEKFFSAGADIKRFLANDVEANMDMIRLAHEALASIARSRKLFVACIAGHALGGGLEIPLACDVRYAIEGRYRLGTPEVTLGILPGNGGTQRLPRLIGAGPALELLTSGRQISPEEALQLGLVSQLFPDQAAFDEQIARLPGAAPARARQHQASGLRGDAPAPGRRSGAGTRSDRGPVPHPDAREGLTAFSEKRSPEFEGS